VIAAMKVALESQVQAFQTQNAAAVANLSTEVGGLSTTVAGLSTVAATGRFSDLTGRPSAVSAITVGAHQEVTKHCSSSSGAETMDLGAVAGKYCASSYNK
jgi:hypothetical protein